MISPHNISRYVVILACLGTCVLSPLAQALQTLQAGDRLDVQVRRQPTYSGTYIVDSAGRIDMPLIGSIIAANRTPEQLGQILTTAYARYIRNPDVTVYPAGALGAVAGRVAEGITLFAVGDLNSPGPYPVDRSLSVLQFAAMLNVGQSPRRGLDQQAALRTNERQPDLSRVMLVRENGDVQMLNVDRILRFGDQRDNVMLEDGDTLIFTVGEPGTFSVFGEISRPGMYQVDTPITIADALVISGGLSRSSDYRQIRVFRGGMENPETLRVNFAELIRLGQLEHMPMIHPGDTVYVPRNWFSKIGDLAELINKAAMGAISINVIERSATHFGDEDLNFRTGEIRR